MMKHKKVKFAAVGVGAAMTALVAATAMAATPPNYTVAVGGSTTAGQHGLTASTVPGTTVVFSALHLDNNTVVNMGCASAAVTTNTNSYVTSGVQTSTGVNPLAQLASVTFSNCTGPGGNMAVTQNNNWTLVGSGAATTAATDVVAGSIGLVSAHVATTPVAAVCNFDVVGQPLASFNEGNQRLSVNDTGYSFDLTLQNVSGCGGQLSDGDPADFVATFAVSVVGGSVNLS